MKMDHKELKGNSGLNEEREKSNGDRNSHEIGSVAAISAANWEPNFDDCAVAPKALNTTNTVVVTKTSKVSAVSDQEKTAAILKLDIDCFEEAFDYFWQKDLISVSKTCKRLHQVAGHCFQQNYQGKATCNARGIQNHSLDMQNLIPFIKKILICDDGFVNFSAVRSKFHQLKQIHIERYRKNHMNWLKERFLAKVEVLCLDRCCLGENFHEIIDLCSKLGRLTINGCAGDYTWLHRKYPTLEYLKIVPNFDSMDSMKVVPKFLELNPNIQKFVTNSRMLLANRDKMLTGNVKLDTLAIEMGHNTQTMCNLVNQFHERGVYRKLQLYFFRIENQEEIDQLAELSGLVKLYVFAHISASLTFSVLKNLEELCLFGDFLTTDFENIANNVVNLKRVHLLKSSIDAVMPFIRRSVEMQRIKIVCLRAGDYFNTHVIDLLALNKAREQLPDAQKITLYVEEKIYLATKWAMKDTDFGLIRLKRDTSYEWNHDFYDMFSEY